MSMNDSAPAGPPPLQSMLMSRQLSATGSSKPIRPSPLSTATSIGAIHDRAVKMVGPKDGHEGLKLSGKVISAACFLPYSLGYRRGGEWVRLLPPKSYQVMLERLTWKNRSSSQDAALQRCTMPSGASALNTRHGKLHSLDGLGRSTSFRRLRNPNRPPRKGRCLC